MEKVAEQEDEHQEGSNKEQDEPVCVRDRQHGEEDILQALVPSPHFLLLTQHLPCLLLSSSLLEDEPVLANGNIVFAVLLVVVGHLALLHPVALHHHQGVALDLQGSNIEQ